jgi:transposase
MRGDDQQQGQVFSYVSAEERVPEDHPLRAVRRSVDQILREMTREFGRAYAKTGRPSIAPERLLRALLLQVFYSIRSERLLMEQLDYNLLFRWFVGLGMDDAVWNHAVFSKNRERLLNQDVARSFFTRVLKQAQPLLSDEHFTVDGTLIEAWASQKSFQRKDGGSGKGVNFRGQQRRNQTHESTTDPQAKLYRKGAGQEAKLSYLGHVLMENRNGLIVDAMVTEADGTARARRGHADGVLALEEAPAHLHPGRRQRLRHARFRPSPARDGGASAPDTECESGGRQRHRRAHHAACRLRNQPEETAPDRTRVRMDEGRRAHAQGQAARATQRGLVVFDDRSGFQPLAYPETGASLTSGDCAVAANTRRTQYPIHNNSLRGSAGLLLLVLQQAPRGARRLDDRCSDRKGSFRHPLGDGGVAASSTDGAFEATWQTGDHADTEVACLPDS